MEVSEDLWVFGVLPTKAAIARWFLAQKRCGVRFYQLKHAERSGHFQPLGSGCWDPQFTKALAQALWLGSMLNLPATSRIPALRRMKCCNSTVLNAQVFWTLQPLSIQGKSAWIDNLLVATRWWSWRVVHINLPAPAVTAERPVASWLVPSPKNDGDMLSLDVFTWLYHN